MREDVLKCICILLKKFIELEDVAKAGIVFSKHGVLSQGQRKKFRGSTDQTFLLKLYSCVQEKGDECFLNAIEDEEFPIDGEVRNLIKFVEEFKKEEWILIISKWNEDGLAPYKKELKKLVKPWSKKTDWFKPLLLEAFNEDILDDEEKPVYHAIMSKIPIPSPKMPEETPKKEGKDEGSDEDNSSETNSTKLTKRKAKKRGKHKHTGNGKKSKNASPDNKITQSEQGDIETTNTDKTEENNVGELKPTRTLPGKRSPKDPKTDDENISGDKTETSTNDKKNTRNSDGNVNGNNKPGINDRKNTGTSKGNKKQNEPSRSVSNQQRQSSNQDTHTSIDKNIPSSESSMKLRSGNVCAPKSDAKNTSSKENGENNSNKASNGPDQNREYNGKANENRNEPSSSDRIFTVTRSDVWPEAFANTERLLEIRAIVSRDSKLPPDKRLCMIFKDSGFKPVQMAYNDRKNFYYLRMHCPADYTGHFIYKFCYKDKNAPEYEYLPGYGVIDRAINMAEVETPWLVVLNVCTFREHHYNWENYCVEELAILLPSPELIFAGFQNENQTSALTDIFCWLNCARHGWTLMHSHYWTTKSTPRNSVGQFALLSTSPLVYWPYDTYDGLQLQKFHTFLLTLGVARNRLGNGGK